MRHRGDAQSRDNAYAGVPKSSRLVNYNIQGPGAPNTWSAISYGGAPGAALNGRPYNYGGFVYTLAGGNQFATIIPEAGIYLCVCAWQINQTCEYYLGWQSNYNLPDLLMGEVNGYAPSFPARHTYSTVMEFKQNDFILPVWFAVGVGATFQGDGSNWYSITKIGGQY